MTRYANLGSDSGIASYEIADESITVEFKNGSVYLYTYESAGPSNVEEMKFLAQAGEGLNAFINRTVRDQYASRLR